MKARKILFLVSVFYLLVSITSVWSEPGKSGVVDYNPKSILIIGWDGFDYRSATQLAETGVLPNFSKLNIVPLLAWPTNSATKVGWSEIETGLGVDWTGILSNTEYNSRIRPAWTIYGVIRKNNPDYWLSRIHSKASQPGDRLNNGKVEPFYYLRLWAGAGNMDRYMSPGVIGYENGFTVKQTRDILMRHISLFRSSGKAGGIILAQFQGPDRVGHVTGMGSEAWNTKMILLDKILGEAVAMMQPDIVFVISDHGFNDWGQKIHTKAPYGMLASNLPLRNDGMRCDFAVTVFALLGIQTNELVPPRFGKNLILME